MADVFFLNGRLLEAAACLIPVQDRSYLLGDGLFETILVHRGKPVFLTEHLNRLYRSSGFLGYKLPPADALGSAAKDVIAANGLEDGSLRINVSPAKSDGLLAADDSPLNIAITCRRGIPYGQDLYERGFFAIVAKSTRRNHLSPLSRHKTTNFLDSVLARKEAVTAGADEALLLNTRGFLAEGTVSNLFLVADKEVLTPRVSDGALPGIVRAKVKSICRKLNIPLRETSLPPEALKKADEAFLTNSLLGIMPLAKVDNRFFSSHEITLQLADEYIKALTEC